MNRSKKEHVTRYPNMVVIRMCTRKKSKKRLNKSYTRQPIKLKKHTNKLRNFKTILRKNQKQKYSPGIILLIKQLKRSSYIPNSKTKRKDDSEFSIQGNFQIDSLLSA